MAVRTKAAPPTPWSSGLAEPKIHSSAYVHSFSRLIGDVRVGANVFIAPGSSIRADEGTPFFIGDSTNIQDGVVIHGLEKGRVRGDNGNDYSVWIGKNTCITHMALIHGPAYVGDECFIGFRSTVFNAKVGDGCIVMMHALIQDVEIPPGKYISSGAVITNQQQANRLPDVQESDRAFAHHVVEINEALLVGYQCAENSSCITPVAEKVSESGSKREKTNKDNNYINSVGNMTSNTDIRGQLKSLLAQGCTLTIEHANKRRFKTKSWLTGGTINARREEQLLAQLDSVLQQHEGEYVKLVGVDPQAKRRVAEVIVQRPGDKPDTRGISNQSNHNSYNNSSNGFSSNGNGHNSMGGGVSDQIKSLLAQGCNIGIERASERRFKTKSWLTVGQVNGSTRNVINELESVAAKHPQDYIRVIGIDSGAKRRVAEIIVQRPGKGIAVGSRRGSTTGSINSYRSNGYSNGNGGHGLSSQTLQQISSLLSAGYKIGTEHASKRRFKTKSWQTCSPIDSTRESDVIAALEACIQEHSDEYVRMIGIDADARRRVSETIIQRPGQTTVKAPTQTKTYVDNRHHSSSNGNGRNHSARNGFASGNLSAETIQQVRSILSAGYKIGTEHASKRRFQTKSWQTCSAVDSSRESDVIAALEACLQEHSGEYVRMIGIDSDAKRRVSETIIQRP